MRSRASRRHSRGFTLTEQELRRIHGAMLDQMSKAVSDQPLSAEYQVWFQNGVISELSFLDEVFELENVGSGRIVGLTMSFASSASSPTLDGVAPTMKINFSDMSVENAPGYYAIDYSVEGEDRDWVFVTSSALDERISRVTHSFPTQFSHKSLPSITLLLVGVAMVAIGLVMMYSTGDSAERIDLLQRQWEQGEIADIGQLLIELHKVQAEITILKEQRFGLPLVATVVLVPLFLFLFFRLFRYAFPAYNFLWGDYTELYQRRKNIARWVIGTLVGAVLLGILANYISSLFGF